MKESQTSNQRLYKYLVKYDPKSPENIEKAKQEKSKKRKRWWESSWINLVTMILALLTLVATIIGLLK